jgi:DNA topoisomerase-1
MQDRRIAKIVSKLQDLPGQDLFQYVDDSGEIRDITSEDVNNYLREITGEDFTAKDFRTWAGTVLAAMALNALGAFETKKRARANIKDAISAVAKLLGNTPAICRKCYVHPAVLENYLDGNTIDGLKRKTEAALEDEAIDLRASEKAILEFLRSGLTRKLT